MLEAMGAPSMDPRVYEREVQKIVVRARTAIQQVREHQAEIEYWTSVLRENQENCGKLEHNVIHVEVDDGQAVLLCERCGWNFLDD